MERFCLLGEDLYFSVGLILIAKMQALQLDFVRTNTFALKSIENWKEFSHSYFLSANSLAHLSLSNISQSCTQSTSCILLKGKPIPFGFFGDSLISNFRYGCHSIQHENQQRISFCRYEFVCFYLKEAKRKSRNVGDVQHSWVVTCITKFT